MVKLKNNHLITITKDVCITIKALTAKANALITKSKALTIKAKDSMLTLLSPYKMPMHKHNSLKHSIHNIRYLHVWSTYKPHFVLPDILNFTFQYFAMEIKDGIVIVS